MVGGLERSPTSSGVPRRPLALRLMLISVSHSCTIKSTSGNHGPFMGANDPLHCEGSSSFGCQPSDKHVFLWQKAQLQVFACLKQQLKQQAEAQQLINLPVKSPK